MGQSVLWKNGIPAFKVKVTVKVWNVNECLSGRYILNYRTFCFQTWYGKLGLMAHHHKVDCLVKRLDCSVVVKVKVTEKVQNSSECSSERYLLSCWSLCNQTWSDDATSWTKVSSKKIGLLSSSSGSQWGLIWSNMTVSTISAGLLIFLQPKLIGWYIIIKGVLCVKIRLLFSRSRSQWRLKTLLNLYVSYIFCTTDLLATIEVCLFTIHNNQTKYNKVGIYWQ